MRTYNHAFSLGVAVPGSRYEKWEDCLKHEKDKVIRALLLRVGELTENNHEFLDALEGFDTYDENFDGFDGPEEDEEENE